MRWRRCRKPRSLTIGTTSPKIPEYLHILKAATPVNELENARIGLAASSTNLQPVARRPARHPVGIWMDAEPARGSSLVWCRIRAGVVWIAR